MAHACAEARRKRVDQTPFRGLQMIGFDKTPISFIQAPRVFRGKVAPTPVPAQQLELRIALKVYGFRIQEQCERVDESGLPCGDGQALRKRPGQFDASLGSAGLAIALALLLLGKAQLLGAVQLTGARPSCGGAPGMGRSDCHAIQTNVNMMTRQQN